MLLYIYAILVLPDGEQGIKAGETYVLRVASAVTGGWRFTLGHDTSCGICFTTLGGKVVA
jgi:hypothetical protein